MNKIFILVAFSFMLISGVSAQNLTQARFYTNFGEFDVELEDIKAPITTQNFISLVDTQYYDGVIWHRVIKNFVIQTGDPTGTGSGGPGYTIQDEFHPQLRHYKRGILSMANSGPNTGGSQFFITMKQVLYLDSLHAVFGTVINGWNVIDSLENVPTDANDRPTVLAVNDSIRILAPVGIDRARKNDAAILGGAVPNPFGEETRIYFGLREAAKAEIRIYDLHGRTLFTHITEPLNAGDHHIIWHGRDTNGNILPNGIYFSQLIIPGFVDAKAIVISR